MRTLVWLQRELRIANHPALESALNIKGDVIVAYFHDPKQTVGEANSAWLAQSLQKLKSDFKALNGDVWFIEGCFSEQLEHIIHQHDIDQVFYSAQVGEPFYSMQNQAYETCVRTQTKLRPFESESWFPYNDINTLSGSPYKMFTPFYNALMNKIYAIESFDQELQDLSKTASITIPEKYDHLPHSLRVIEKQPWAQKVLAHWQVGETAAWNNAKQFIDSTLLDYSQDRDFPGVRGTSHLSPHLHFGEIHSRALLIWLMQIQQANGFSAEIESWTRQLGWREFARYILWHFPETQTQPFQGKFKGFYLRLNQQTNQQFEIYQAWREGQTGVPIIDAGMRQLWETGWMHNRVRMLVASWLTKNAGISWVEGMDWFKDTLVDADPANNIMGWQWVAGCGVDAAPYYRLFNPIKQSEKFDKEGEYIRHWVLELKKMPGKMIHAPWQFIEETSLYQVTLGEDYPLNKIDLTDSRDQHLQKVGQLKETLNNRVW